MEAIRTTCAYCGVGCGIEATVTGPRNVTIAGDPAHPANRGRLCSKGTYLGETVGLEGRLLRPMIGAGAVGWDRALDEVAARLGETIAEHGPDAVGFYVSGQLLTEDYYVVNKLAKGFVGTGNIDTNSRLCMASAVAAHNRAFGEDVVPCSYDDLERADLIVLVGSNTAWCHPVIWQRIEQSRAERGTKLVVIDPRRTETADRADLHIAVAPDGDVALFNALLAALWQRDVVDHDYMETHCDVPADLLSALDCDPGIEPAQFARLVDLVAAHPRMVTMFSQGANQSVSGTDKGNAIINLHLATGRINMPGAGPFSITGQPNAMGGREVGGLANILACHLGFSSGERAAVAEFWNAPNICAGPGLKAVEMFEAVHSGKIKFLWVMATNPAVSMPNAGFVREALRKCPTLVVSDIIADSDTARLADIRLPALAWGEKDGTVTNSERCISRQRALLPPPGEARADWRIVCDVAQRLGHASAFDFAGPAQIFGEYAAMTGLARDAGYALDLTAWANCTVEGYDAMQPFQWGGLTPFAGGYSHPDGRARLVAVDAVTAGATEDEAFPLRLNTGRYRDQWHTMTRTGLSPRLGLHRREPLLEVHPADAKANGLTDDGFARAHTAHGQATYRVRFHDGQRPGEVFVPMHWSGLTGGQSGTGRLVHPLVDPVSGQPAFKNVAARITPVVPGWRAFVLTREPLSAPILASAIYWAQARIEGGWLTEIAADGAVDLDGLLPEGARGEAADRKRGMQRIVVQGADGSLEAGLYLTRSGVLPARDWIVRQFARPDAAIVELLAARPSVPAPDRGALVCVCHDVCENDLLTAIGTGSDNVKAVGEATRAGTNCGSCRTIIASLIDRIAHDQKEGAE